MHEMSIAMNLMATITAEAKKQDAKPISAKISCGFMNAINDDILIEAFVAITKGTSCEGMKIEIEHKPITAKCKECQAESVIDFSMFKCSKCESEQLELLPDAPLLLEEIEMEKI